MGIHGWFLAFHLFGIVLYIGGLLALARLLFVHAREQDGNVRQRMCDLEKATLNWGVRLGATLTIAFGLMLFLGVGIENMSMREAVGSYMKPLAGKNHDVPTPFYATFHAKFVMLLPLFILHGVLEAKAAKAARGEQLKPGNSMAHAATGVAILAFVIIGLMKTDILKGSGPIAQAKREAKLASAEKDKTTGNEAGKPTSDIASLREKIAKFNARPEHKAQTVEVVHILIGISMPRLPHVKRTPEEAETLAASVLKRIENGEDFNALKMEFSDDNADGNPGIYTMVMSGPSNPGAGIYPRAGMARAFGDTGWRLEIGEVAVAAYDQDKSPFGYHIIKRLK